MLIYPSYLGGRLVVQPVTIPLVIKPLSDSFKRVNYLFFSESQFSKRVSGKMSSRAHQRMGHLSNFEEGNGQFL